MNIRECLKDTIPYSAGKSREGAIKLSSNENPLGVSPKAKEMIMQYATKSSIYPDGACTNLKAALASKYSLSSSNFIIGNGSDEVLILIAGAYIESGDNAITSETTFSEYTFATKLFGGTMRFSPMIDGKIQLDKIISLIDEKTKIIFVCNPNNPTGTYFNNNALTTFVNNVPKHVLIVIDEAYQEYSTAKDFPDSISLLNKHQNVIVLHTFSKIYGLAGLRVGYGISNSGVINDLEKARAPFNVSSISQAAAIAALDDSDFVKTSQEVNKKGKEFLYAAFDKLGLKYYQTEANFITVYVKQDCMEAFEKLINLGVAIRPLRSFGINDAIRVTIGTEEQNRFFIDCLKKIL